MSAPLTIELVDGPCDGRRVLAGPAVTPVVWVLLPGGDADTWARYVSQDELRAGAIIYRYTPEEAAAA